MPEALQDILTEIKSLEPLPQIAMRVLQLASGDDVVPSELVEVIQNDAAVTATIVSGEPVFERGEFVEGYGTTLGTGRFLRAGEPRGTVAPVRRAEQLVAQ